MLIRICLTKKSIKKNLFVYYNKIIFFSFDRLILFLYNNILFNVQHIDPWNRDLLLFQAHVGVFFTVVQFDWSWGQHSLLPDRLWHPCWGKLPLHPGTGVSLCLWGYLCGHKNPQASVVSDSEGMQGCLYGAQYYCSHLYNYIFYSCCILLYGLTITVHKELSSSTCSRPRLFTDLVICK